MPSPPGRSEVKTTPLKPSLGFTSADTGWRCYFCRRRSTGLPERPRRRGRSASDGPELRAGRDAPHRAARSRLLRRRFILKPRRCLLVSRKTWVSIRVPADEATSAAPRLSSTDAGFGFRLRVISLEETGYPRKDVIPFT